MKTVIYFTHVFKDEIGDISHVRAIHQEISKKYAAYDLTYALIMTHYDKHIWLVHDAVQSMQLQHVFLINLSHGRDQSYCDPNVQALLRQAFLLVQVPTVFHTMERYLPYVPSTAQSIKISEHELSYAIPDFWQAVPKKPEAAPPPPVLSLDASLAIISALWRSNGIDKLVVLDEGRFKRTLLSDAMLAHALIILQQDIQWQELFALIKKNELSAAPQDVLTNPALLLSGLYYLHKHQLLTISNLRFCLENSNQFYYRVLMVIKFGPHSDNLSLMGQFCMTIKDVNKELLDVASIVVLLNKCFPNQRAMIFSLLNQFHGNDYYGLHEIISTLDSANILTQEKVRFIEKNGLVNVKKIFVDAGTMGMDVSDQLFERLPCGSLRSYVGLLVKLHGKECDTTIFQNIFVELIHDDYHLKLLKCVFAKKMEFVEYLFLNNVTQNVDWTRLLLMNTLQFDTMKQSGSPPRFNVAEGLSSSAPARISRDSGTDSQCKM